MHWDDLPEVIDAWVVKTAAPAFDVRRAAAGVITATHVGYYCDPGSDRVGIYCPGASARDASLAKAAALRATGVPPLFLSYQDLAAPDAAWVKAAHSPALRGAGELLNFFPGQYPGGVPNAPSPVAAMLTSGLVGAGLGWGAGRLIGGALPGQYGKRLSRTGAVLGGLLGAAPGLAWGSVNRATGKPFNDPGLLAQPADAEPVNFPTGINGANAELTEPGSDGLDPVREFIRDGHFHKVKLGADYTRAVEKVAVEFGQHHAPPPGLPTDVSIDALGRTLWDTGASPALAATAMGTMYAAQQLPDPRSRPGVVTGHQLGQLAVNAAGDYATGYMVGAVLNAAVGTPHRASAYGLGATALGVIGAVVPKLFGR